MITSKLILAYILNICQYFLFVKFFEKTDVRQKELVYEPFVDGWSGCEEPLTVVQ